MWVSRTVHGIELASAAIVLALCAPGCALFGHSVISQPGLEWRVSGDNHQFTSFIIEQQGKQLRGTYSDGHGTSVSVPVGGSVKNDKVSFSFRLPPPLRQFGMDVAQPGDELWSFTGTSDGYHRMSGQASLNGKVMGSWTAVLTDNADKFG
jgi:hypothetical protein